MLNWPNLQQLFLTQLPNTKSIHPSGRLNMAHQYQSSKTPLLSKCYEGFLVDWLLNYIRPYLDPNQFGGLKGTSVTNYLIKFLHFIFSSLDSKEPSSVLAVLVDLSKAFNKVDHNLVIEDLFNMNCPAFLLRILFSYLSDRSIIVNFKGESAKR